MSRTLRILFSLALMALVLSFADWHAVGEVLQTVQLKWVACALGLALLDRLLLNYRWHVLLAAGGVCISFWRLFRVQLAANFLGSFLPSSLGVDAVRIAALCRAGEPAALVIAATMVDRATLVIATFIFGSATILLLAQTRIPPDIARVVLLATLVGISICFACLHPAVRRWVRVHLLVRLPERLRQTAANIAQASLAYRHDSALLGKIAVATVVTFATRMAFAKAIVLACGIDVPFTDLLLVIPILWIVVMLPITVGGLGVQDAGYVVLMSFIGVSAPVAASMSLVEHIVVRVAMLPGALFLKEFAVRSAKEKI